MPGSLIISGKQAGKINGDGPNGRIAVQGLSIGTEAQRNGRDLTRAGAGGSANKLDQIKEITVTIKTGSWSPRLMQAQVQGDPVKGSVELNGNSSSIRINFDDALIASYKVGSSLDVIQIDGKMTFIFGSGLDSAVENTVGALAGAAAQYLKRLATP